MGGFISCCWSEIGYGMANVTDDSNSNIPDGYILKTWAYQLNRFGSVRFGLVWIWVSVRFGSVWFGLDLGLEPEAEAEPLTFTSNSSELFSKFSTGIATGTFIF